MNHRKPYKVAAGFLIALCLSGCSQGNPNGESAPPGSVDHIRTVTLAIDDEALKAADANQGDWLSYGRNYSEDRYSELDQITPDNLDELGIAWTLELTSTRGIQATPIVVDGIMYFTGPWSVVYAVDARKGEILWTFDPEVPRAKAADMCCGIVNRGVALHKGAIFVGTMDGRLVSIDAATGDANWSVMTVPDGSNYSITGAPRIANGKVVIGNAGAEYGGVRGYVTAYDATTGDQVWRFYTVPGNPSLPFENPILEMAAETWTGEWWKQGGGGTAWDSIVFDPEFKSVYIGVGNGTHWDHRIRSPEGGDNLFLSSIVAVDADTGAYKWHYQTTPGDTWDYTATQPIVLADLKIEGEPRKVLMQAPKNGFFYVIDREDGALISAEPFSYVNWAKKIGEDGRPIEEPGARYDDGRTHWIAPSSHGAHNWFPMSFNHETQLVYIPGVVQSGAYADNSDMSFSESGIIRGNDLAVSAAFKAFNEQVIDPDAPPPGDGSGELIAYDPIKQERVWAIPQPSRYNGGLLSTKTGLLMQGDAEGMFSIRDTQTGEILKRFDVNSGVISAPVTYLVDGEQYITLIAEWGGGQGQSFRLTDALYYGTVYTFKLGGTAPAPEKLPSDRRELTTRTTDAEPLELGWGFIHYLQNCAACHSLPGEHGGAIPNLARSSDSVYDNLEAIVLEGTYAGIGMPVQPHLNPEEVDLIRNFIYYVAQSMSAGQSRGEILRNVAEFQRIAFEHGPLPSSLPDNPSGVELLDTADPTSGPGPESLSRDAEAGQRSAAICATCHTFAKGGANGNGPNLWGTVGRDIASVEGFRYSNALQDLEGNWTVEALDAYLKSPTQFARGTTMAVGAPRDKQRADIIAYLETLRDN
ncbi:PQQ-dependent dehydrogenase, methanol/ethanol family [Hyphomonas sp.]|uniref:PQQ-dependent dehydrogenase, methanol/ethanol family n=1 Tax=Hyphomonas sp. TaxID=87 RepID=UPI0032EE823B